MIPSASQCPHCDARAPRRLGRRLLALGTMVGMGSLSLTLMACYGSPCVSDPDACRREPPPDDMSVQLDLRPAPSPNDDGGVDGGP